MIDKKSVWTRRALLNGLGMALPIGAGLTFGQRAFGFSQEKMPAAITKVFRDRCAADAMHAPTLEAAFARLDAAGVEYDRAELASSLRCPICGCSIITGTEASDGRGRRPPPF